MRRFYEFLLLVVFNFLFSLRYRVTIKGLEKINAQTLKKKGGILFLPNHPTIIVDPMMVGMALISKFRVRPVIVEYMYYYPGIRQVMDLVQALPIPKFSSTSNSLKVKKNENVIKTIVNEVKKGNNFLIYPGGRLKQTAKEIIGGNSAIHRILHAAPETNVVLVRTKGLWGSLFSNALEKTPELGATIWDGIKIALKNGIFFIPKREVIIELEPAPSDFPYQGTRVEINNYLERWYNQPDGLKDQSEESPGDSLVLVPYTFWSKELPKIASQKAADISSYELSDLHPEVRNKVIKKVAELAETDPAAITPQMSLSVDLGMDSLDTAELLVFLQDEFEISGVPVNELSTVGKLMAIAGKLIECKEDQSDTQKVLNKWWTTASHQPITIPPGDTMVELFLNVAAHKKHAPALADPRAGVLNYNQLTMRTILLASHIQKFPGKYVGVLLPASVAATVCVFAIQLAGKVPLMLNWTVGPRHLESVLELTDVKTILTSWSFLDKLESVDLTPIEDRLLMLEDLRKDFTLKDKLKAWGLAKLGTKKILGAFTSEPLTEDNQAVLLFTSGTENMPKGVPLTHRNILSNLRASLSCVEVFEDESFLGILPPFHSFGFLTSGFLGLAAGVKTFLYPNPTDGKRLADVIDKWKINLICAAPTFLKGILKSAKKGQLDSLRLCVTGAEKAPPELFQMLQELGKSSNIIEGYGITECSPVLTLTRMDKPLKGVGEPIPGVELLIVDPETHQPLPLGTRGLILASGPNIFSGYINPGLEPPFIDVQGKNWYKTGDLGFLDEQGILTISGRLKRFIKVGPEMISLPAIEDALLHIGLNKGWWPVQESPALAICAKEEIGEKPKIIAISKFAVQLEDINRALREQGFSNLVKVSAVYKIDEIPLMGTGKINYRALEAAYFK